MLIMNFAVGILFSTFSTVAITKCIHVRKIRNIYYILFLIALSFLMGFQEDIADFSIYFYNYQHAFDEPFYSSSQWCQTLVEQVFYRLGIPFLLFRTIYFFAGLLLVFRVANKTMENPILLILAYCLFPMIIDAAQMKNFMAMAIMSNAFVCLIDNKKHKYLRYIILNCIAAGFQITAYMYVPFFIFYFLYKKSLLSRKLIEVVMLFYFLFFSLRSNAELVRYFFLNSLTGSFHSRTEKFFVSNVNYGYLVFFVTTAMVIALMYRNYMYVSNLNRQRKENVTSISKMSTCDLALALSIYSIAFIPLYYFAQDFSRLIRNFSIMFHVSIINSLNFVSAHGLKSRKNRLSILIGYLFYIAYSFYWEIAIYKDVVLIPFFSF